MYKVFIYFNTLNGLNITDTLNNLNLHQEMRGDLEAVDTPEPFGEFHLTYIKLLNLVAYIEHTQNRDIVIKFYRKGPESDYSLNYIAF